MGNSSSFDPVQTLSCCCLSYLWVLPYKWLRLKPFFCFCLITKNWIRNLYLAEQSGRSFDYKTIRKHVFKFRHFYLLEKNSESLTRLQDTYMRTFGIVTANYILSNCSYIALQQLYKNSIETWTSRCKLDALSEKLYTDIHGLRTPNECIDQRNLKFWADVADKICFGRTYRFGIGIWFSAVFRPCSEGDFPTGCA